MVLENKNNMKDNDFQLVLGCKGYVSKPDITATNELYLVAGSRNMLVNEQEKVESRAGTKLFGQASATATPPKSKCKWENSNGEEILLREIGGVLLFYSDVTSQWEELLTGLSATHKVRFATPWNATELIDVLLFVNHSAILYEWSGGRTTFLSATTNTITKQGATFFGEHRFLANGTRAVRIKDDTGVWREFVYTGGEGSATLTGVTPDPTGFSFTAGAQIVQKVRSNADEPAAGIVNDVIGVLENQVYLGSVESRVVYISKNSSYTDYSFSTPRVPGEGAQIILDDISTGFMPDDETMYIFSGKNRAYSTKFILSSGSTSDREIVKVKPIVVGSNQGAISQEMIMRTKGSIVYINNDNELVELAMSESGQRKLVETPISDAISPDFEVADFTNGNLHLFRSSIFVSAPADSLVFIFDITKKVWQPPQTLPVRLFTDYQGRLYGHSNVVSETYLLFEGLRDKTDPTDNDSGNPILFKANFAYRNAGARNKMKNFDKYFHELYMTSNAEITHKILYEYGGSKGEPTYLMKGSEEDFIVQPSASASLGVNSLGTNPFGGTIEVPTEMPKYRRIRPNVPVDFFEFQSTYECDTLDAKFQLLAHGPNMVLSKNSPSKITK